MVAPPHNHTGQHRCEDCKGQSFVLFVSSSAHSWVVFVLWQSVSPCHFIYQPFLLWLMSVVLFLTGSAFPFTAGHCNFWGFLSVVFQMEGLIHIWFSHETVCVWDCVPINLSVCVFVVMNGPAMQCSSVFVFEQWSSDSWSKCIRSWHTLEDKSFIVGLDLHPRFFDMTKDGLYPVKSASIYWTESTVRLVCWLEIFLEHSLYFFLGVKATWVLLKLGWEEKIKCTKSGTPCLNGHSAPVLGQKSVL